MMRNFSQQFKEQAVAYVLDHPQEPMKALAQSLGLGITSTSDRLLIMELPQSTAQFNFLEQGHQLQ
jgi:hypothetical protein